MWIKDIFSRRTPSHLIMYFLYKNEEKKLYKFLSKITHSIIGSTSDIDGIVNKVRLFIRDNEGLKLKQINLTSYGTGYNLIEGLTKEETIRVLDELMPIMTKDTNIMFTTCYSGTTLSKITELSEHYSGMAIYGMKSNYGLTAKMNRCSCKKGGYSQATIKDIPESKYGLSHDEVMVVNTIRRDENELINWERCGMSYVYNEKMMSEGICEETPQPYTLMRSIINYIFNIR